MPIRVAVADGSDRARQVLRWLLEEDGRFTVVGDVADGDGAVTLAAEADVLVTEISLPGIDGLTVLQRIGAEHPGVPVVIYSAYTQPYLRAEAEARGAAAFVSKDAPFEQLAGVLADVTVSG